MFDLIHDDCLIELPKIADKSVDLVVIDPPYNIKKAEWDTWKTVKEYVEFMGKVFTECERVLKDNGSFYFFHNDFMQIVELQNWLNKNTRFVFKSLIHWIKPNFRPISWKNPSPESKLRTWFNCVEYCMFYTFQDETGLESIYNDFKLFIPIRDYFKNERLKTKLTYKEINENCFGSSSNGGGMASNILTSYKQGWEFPTKEKYEKLQKIGICKRSYESLRQEYESLRQEYESLRYTHNLDENHNNIWYSNIKNTGKNHPTEKPLDIIERIIKTSSNENDIVLDCFMGSGTTGVACKNLNRHFIGIEKDKTYFELSKKRIYKAQYIKEEKENSIIDEIF